MYLLGTGKNILVYMVHKNWVRFSEEVRFEGKM